MSDTLEEEEYGKLEYTRLVSNEQVLINSPVMWEEEPRVDKNHPFSVEKNFLKKVKIFLISSVDNLFKHFKKPLACYL